MQSKPDEYLPWRWRNAAWICYASVVCGFINGISLAGVYRTPTSHLTGITTRAAISFASGSGDDGWLSKSGAGAGPEYLVVVLVAFGIGAFIAGFTLAEKHSDGSYSSIRLDYPSAREWRWQHQLLISACLLCLLAANALLRDDRVTADSGHDASFVASVSLTACCAAIFNCVFMLGTSSFIALRAGSVTGSLTDTFLNLGSSLRCRSSRYLWKVRLHAIAFSGFATGGLAGCAAFNAIGSRQLTHAVAVLIVSPLWLFGANVLVRRHLAHRRQQLGVNLSETLFPKQPAAAALAATASGADSTASGGRVREVESVSISGASSTPSLAVLDEFPDEFENEGLGMLIYRLPRINVLEDLDMSSGRGSQPPALRSAIPGEYETIRYVHFVWIVYLAFIAGALNAITMQGIFQQPSSNTSGRLTVLLYSLVHPPAAGATGNASSSFGAVTSILLAFCLACFVCGFVLTAPSSADASKYVIRKIDYPNANEWRWKHQVIVSLCIASLCASYGIARGFAGSNKNFADGVSYQQPAYSGFLFACACSAFAAGVLNSLSSYGRRITVRSAHVTGSVNDLFLGLGFALRSRSLRFMWRVRVLLFNFLAFFTGGVCGSLVFRSSFGATAVMFPAILLVPLWLAGIGMLFARRLQKRARP